ncbi:MAG: ABC transporter transmembrane domain-containing protein [Planctomycetota bacterium]
MSNFARALRLALRQRLGVAACVFTSLMIAVLWAGNLVAVWPIVDAVMQDQSVPEWIDKMIAEDHAAIAELEVTIAQLEVQLADGPAQDKLLGLQQELSEAEDDLQAYTWQVSCREWVEPYADRWLPSTPFQTLLCVCAFVVFGTLTKSFFRVANVLAVTRVSALTTLELRNEYYRKVLRLDLAAFGGTGRGDIMNRCTTDLGALAGGIQSVFGAATREPLKMIACTAGAAYFSWRLLLLTIVMVPLAVFVIRWLARAIKRANRRALEELSSILETLSETLSSIQLIKAFTMEPAERARFNASAKTLYFRQLKIAVYDSLMSPVTETVGVSMVVMAAVAGGFLVLHEQTHLLGFIRISDTPLTHGQMAVFFAMLAGMSDPARRLTPLVNAIQKASASADRVYEVLDREPTIVDPPKAKTLPDKLTSVQFRDVSFHYEPTKQVLTGVNLDVGHGETVAIVGPNGCGKSTLLNLLPRFYDVSEGAVLLGGVDCRDVRLRELRRRIGIVSQQAVLMNDTVRANIAYGTQGATPEQVEQAARKAYAHGFITSKLTDGYDTVVGHGGSRLSGGQRQRIALARAILRDPEILILDEATSQIDLESEQLIHQVLREFVVGRTTLIITHRPSTLSLADRVVVMDAGRIEDIGTPEELLDRCDLFRRLCHGGYRASA